VLAVIGFYLEKKDIINWRKKRMSHMHEVAGKELKEKYPYRYLSKEQRDEIYKIKFGKNND